ncbi:glycosyltransferase [Paucihalobacter ruber]|uniref:Glycosyltransferase n=1 Tax=Paucihalobacter ruber TaxID=2567861 RepID=A0A506PJR9_9FLAO|nr:glycosyltransferase [Paucihalobacter ruber]TPV33869.1 glycosyltransferase [Paucihalobacter ruber]
MYSHQKTYIICTSPKGNAISNYFFSLAKALHNNGNKVVIVVDKKNTNIKEYNGIPVVTWPSKRPTKLKDFIFFYKLCKQYKPDVTLGQFGATNLVLLVSKLLGIRNRWVYWHTMFLQIQTDSKSSSFKLWLLELRKKLLLRGYATQILTNSKATKQDLIHHFNFKEEQVNVLHLLISDYFENQPIKSKADRQFAVAFAGRMDNSKGQEHLVEAIPQILEQYPTLMFYFIGDGPNRAALEQRCTALKISDHIHFLGNLKLDFVYLYMSNVLIHISASKEEAFGLVNVEALSAGTPIIANNVGGIKDILVNGKNGYFCENDTFQIDLIKNITQILEGDWNAMSEFARKDFIDRFKYHDNNMSKQLNILNSLLT